MKFFLGLVIVVFVTACTPYSAPPVINKSPARKIPPSYVVKQGDSIYNIAWAYGLDFRDMIKWNRLKKPYPLKPGQTIALRKDGTARAVKTTPLKANAQSTPEKPIVATTLPAKKPLSTAKTDAASAPAVTFSKAPSQWNWPAEGKLIGKFSPSKGSNGIQITGTQGSPIKATAAGDVVYVGEGLRGYGKLIIVKHSTRFLSAYAHNQDMLVEEGQRIKSGQQIARMGKSGTKTTMLHFEIRENGQSVNPLKYLK